jgi:hypothetical protein
MKVIILSEMQKGISFFKYAKKKKGLSESSYSVVAPSIQVELRENTSICCWYPFAKPLQ